MEWSHGEVIKPETINYRTQRPEKDGLFSERIFGPTNDYECYCGKYRRIRYKGIVCDKCGVEVTRAAVRRERFGHITLAAPVAHIWFLKSVPSRLSLFLDVSTPKLERVIYYSAYIVTDVDEEAQNRALVDLDAELKVKMKNAGETDKKVREELIAAASQIRGLLNDLRVGQVLGESEYFNLARRFGHVFQASTGAEAVRQILEDMDLHKEIAKIEEALAKARKPASETRLLRRLRMFRSMIQHNTRPEWLVLKVLPVLPPDLRPMVALDGGRYATSDLNDLYRRVINRNNRLKKLLEIRAPDVIVKNEKRMLQEAVDALIDNSARFGTQQLSAQRRPLRSLADMLKGKQGRFRQNLLGKRVDYSGRSVIVVGPHLDIGSCGLPKKMALELFRPFVIGEIIRRELAHNIKAANRMIEQAGDEIWAILEEIIRDRRVLLNRAPTLHRLSIQAFKPILIEGLAIQIPPLVCAAFNADFDGDQMAVHVPLSDAAQREAREIMASSGNLLKPATGDLIANPSLDMVLGVYYATQLDPDWQEKPKPYVNLIEALLAYDQGCLGLRTPIQVDNIKTSLGRLLVSEIFGETLEGGVQDTLTKKKLAKTIERVVEKFGFERGREIIDRIKHFGFEMASRSGITWAMSDLIIPVAKQAILAKTHAMGLLIGEQYQSGLLTENERRNRVIASWEKTKGEIMKLATTTLPPQNPIFQIIDSGSRGSWTQANQMLGMKGLVANPKGETIELPIASSYKEGLSVLEYFISTHGARKGTTDTALKTAQAGYLTRRLVDVAQDISVREMDCKTKESVEVSRAVTQELGQSFATRIFSRVAAEDVKLGNKILIRAGEIIDRTSAENIDLSKIESVRVRSPITCKTLFGVCAACYGLDLGTNRPIELGRAVGVIAAQSIGEPGTQLTMRTFHTGGIAGADITHGLPRIEEIFEARPPKGKAILAEAEGRVVKIEDRETQRLIHVQLDGKKAKTVEYSVPRSAQIYVEQGSEVLRGQQLSEGNLDLRELLRFRGVDAVIHYVTNEVQKIYLSEGAAIHNKHLEVIVKQMFSRVKIKEPGDADFVIGEIIPKSRFLELNRELKRQGRKPARAEQMLLGITRISLSTDSFLSAASFQDTARVLVKAAIESRVDPLRGLKENVIIGRLIPSPDGSDDDVVPLYEETEGESVEVSPT
ncbi:MAG: DNA-directed RNA polymerase subunit beta' [Candidatus Liptonbacteria bacterium]|nr:DNA-directed RNA polymerase subunit beta' [Candidatus Liptonbacteria bacterium]